MLVARECMPSAVVFAAFSWALVPRFRAGMDNIGSISVQSRFGSVQCVGPTILEMESDWTDSRMNLDRTEPRLIQKQRRLTDRSSPWMTIGPDWTDAHINLGRDMRCSLRLILKCHKQSSVMLHTQNEVKFVDYTDDVA